MINTNNEKNKPIKIGVVSWKDFISMLRRSKDAGIDLEVTTVDDKYYVEGEE